jgi:hypothetical protein
MFQATGLSPEPFAPLFALSDEALVAQGARRVFANAPDAFPCRVSLRRVDPGEELLLLNFAHRPEPSSPYRAAGPIFVSRRGQGTFRDALPPIMRDRVLALKAYDAEAFIVDATLAGDEAALDVVRGYLVRLDVVHVDAHFASRGCFAARFERDTAPCG